MRWRFIARACCRTRAWSRWSRPALIPLAGASAATLALRFALWGGERTLAQALAEALLFGGVYLAGAAWRERPLVSELLRAVRPAQPASPQAPPPPA